MAEPSTEQARLWALIISCGLEEEYERDWLGRIKSRRTNHYLKAEITPELAQMLASTSTQIAGIAGGAKAALAAGQSNMRQLLSRLQEPNKPE